MRELSLSNFGLLIAYLLPGFVALWGVGELSATARDWLRLGPAVPTVGGFLYVTMASVGTGLIVNTVRWMLVDTLHHRTGISAPSWDFRNLPANLPAFELLVEAHYRHYLFHANLLVAMTFDYLVWTASGRSVAFGWLDAAFFALVVVLFAGSRDTLQKYYRRGEQLLASRAARE